MIAAIPDPAAILFDLDGTLVDTVGHRVDAWLQAFAEQGIKAHRAQLGPYMGADGRRIAREIAAQDGRELDQAEAVAIDRRAGDLFDVLNHAPSAHPGVRELLAALDSVRLPWAIATSSLGVQAQGSVAALGLSEPRITDGSQVAHAKPAPDLLFAGAALVGQPPDRCWYVGDATWDMQAATAAGMVGIGVASGHSTEADLRASGASWTVPSLTDLHAELRRRGIVPG